MIISNNFVMIVGDNFSVDEMDSNMTC